MTMWGLLPNQQGVNGQLQNRLITIHRARSFQPVQLVKCHVRLAMYNLQTCAVGVEGWLELALLAGQLSNLGIGLCGL
jgi:hypothetical protein